MKQSCQNSQRNSYFYYWEKQLPQHYLKKKIMDNTRNELQQNHCSQLSCPMVSMFHIHSDIPNRRHRLLHSIFGSIYIRPLKSCWIAIKKIMRKEYCHFILNGSILQHSTFSEVIPQSLPSFLLVYWPNPYSRHIVSPFLNKPSHPVHLQSVCCNWTKFYSNHVIKSCQ